MTPKLSSGAELARRDQIGDRAGAEQHVGVEAEGPAPIRLDADLEAAPQRRRERHLADHRHRARTDLRLGQVPGQRRRALAGGADHHEDLRAAHASTEDGVRPSGRDRRRRDLRRAARRILSSLRRHPRAGAAAGPTTTSCSLTRPFLAR